MRASAVAPSNLAIVKYWGKRDLVLNLPARDSISVTTADLATATTVRFMQGGIDRIQIDGMSAQPHQVHKMARVLDELRRRAGTSLRAEVVSHSNFPSAAGLASSASGLCALTLAASRALSLDLPQQELMAVARLGSGSATRSFLGGFVRWYAGVQPDGSDSVARQLSLGASWPLEILVVLVSRAPKATSSTEGMVHTASSSVYHQPWLDSLDSDLRDAEAAIASGDLGRLGEVAEHNALKMHANMLAARPALIYWHPGTVEVIHAIREARSFGFRAWCTIDAGANVAVLTHPDEADALRERLLNLSCGPQVLRSKIGAAAHYVDSHLEPR